MTSREFCYWLMGSLELVEPEDGLNEKQTQILKNHLNMCFVHVAHDEPKVKTGFKSKESPPLNVFQTTGVESSPQINC